MTSLAQRSGSTAQAVPFFDLAPSHRGLREEILADIAELLETNAYTNGPAVASFEAAFASVCGASACVGVASGLDALRLALVAAGLEPGDEVVVPAATFVATAEAVTQAGGSLVVADISDVDYGLDPAALEAAIGARTRFVVPVHLYGQMADVVELRRVADGRGVSLVEDACQAHGGSRDGIGAGTAGVAAAFSFYPGKNLGAIGDAGAVVTSDPDLAARIRTLREHGQSQKYRHDEPGWTARLDTVQALVLGRKLPYLKRWNFERAAAAAFYGEALREVGDLRLPQVAAGSEPAWHLFVVRTADPEALAGFLAERGIGTGRHYPQPVHLTRAYASLGIRSGAFPVSERLCAEALSLPLFPGITESQLESVVDTVQAYFERG